MASPPRMNRIATRPAARPASPAPVKTVAVGVPKVALVHTATLIRGRTYVYRGQHFKAHIPEIVTKEVADTLAEEFHSVTDGEGENIEKPYFDVNYNVPAPVEEKEEKIVHRLQPTRVFRR